MWPSPGSNSFDLLSLGINTSVAKLLRLFGLVCMAIGMRLSICRRGRPEANS
jgi:hypothetical protein